MLSNEQIKDRFFSDPHPIDRHGNFINVHSGNYDARQSYIRRIHYELLDGVPTGVVKSNLRDFDLSDTEIEFILSKSITFITDVLQIPFDTIIEGRNSTEGHVRKTIMDGLQKVKEDYDNKRELPIIWKDRTFQTDLKKTRVIMLDYLTTSIEPGRWIDVNNDYVENFTLSDLRDLYTSIVLRDKNLFDEMEERKQALRKAGEANDYDSVVSHLREWFG